MCLEFLPVYSPTRTPVYSEDRYSARAEVWETVLHLLQKTTVQLRPVCPGFFSATHATTRPSRHTYGLSIVLAPDRIWRFSYNGLVSKIAIALPYSRAHGSRPFLYARIFTLCRVSPMDCPVHGGLVSIRCLSRGPDSRWGTPT